ncbi:hypothetical protein [Streptomyces sp. NPDC058155]|uniref:hypothetical protein n=1 Tax=Streptomyces sp. NPDC058155 TaxID=3346359 RepID=UPI0036F0079F
MVDAVRRAMQQLLVGVPEHGSASAAAIGSPAAPGSAPAATYAGQRRMWHPDRFVP